MALNNDALQPYKNNNKKIQIGLSLNIKIYMHINGNLEKQTSWFNVKFRWDEKAKRK